MHKFSCEHAFSVLLNKYLGEGLLSHIASIYFILQKLPNCFPEWLYHFAFPPSLSAFGGVSVPDFGHSSRCAVLSHFDLHFPVTFDEEHLFTCLFAFCTSLLMKCLLKFLALF